MKIEQLNMPFPGEGDVALILARADGGELVGTVCVRRVGGLVAEFARLFVVESRRSQGIGRELVARAEKVARDAGCVSLTCNVNPSNKRARLFYSRLGFHPAYHFADGDILMARPIAPLSVVQSPAQTEVVCCGCGSPVVLPSAVFNASGVFCGDCLLRQQQESAAEETHARGGV